MNVEQEIMNIGNNDFSETSDSTDCLNIN